VSTAPISKNGRDDPQSVKSYRSAKAPIGALVT
jgi:hypothetical protein